MPTTLLPLFTTDAVRLNLAGATRDAVLEELVDSLDLPEETHLAVRRLLDVREAKGSTGVGHGVAMPHARCDEMDSLRMAYGRHPDGLDWEASDGQPVRHVFLILAPPIHVSNQYLQVMGEVARLVRDAEVRQTLDAVKDVDEFMALIRANQ